MIAKILLWLTPVIFFASLGITSYGLVFTVAFVAVTLFIAAALHQQPNRAVASSAFMFAALWWIVWPAAASAVLVAVGVLLPRRWWLVGVLGVGALVTLAILNPPAGPVHLGGVAGIVLVAHAVLVGAIALVALRGGMERST